MSIRDDVDVRTEAALAEDVLERSREMVRPGLQAALRRVSPELSGPLAEHLGSGGKFVRAALVLLSASATGGSDAMALDGAVAIELVHNFSLVHDDLIDGDTERRHRPTVWSAHGADRAVIAGDALATVAFQVLLEVPTEERAAAASLLADATQAMISGQATDMALESRGTATLEECLEMVSGKTAALLRCAATLGAVLVGATDAAIRALWEYGHHLGVAFQAVDDLLGIWGAPEVTGKPVGNDLRRRKKTIPVCLAASQGARLSAAFWSPSDEPLDDGEVARLRTTLERCGARDATAHLADRHLRDALDALDRAELRDPARRELAALARYVVDRDR